MCFVIFVYPALKDLLSLRKLFTSHSAFSGDRQDPLHQALLPGFVIQDTWQIGSKMVGLPIQKRLDLAIPNIFRMVGPDFWFQNWYPTCFAKE